MSSAFAKTRIPKSSLAVLLAASLVACSVANADPLAGSEWAPIELAGAPVKPVDRPGSAPIIKFNVGNVTGNGGCNRFSAAFTTSIKKDHPEYGNLNIGPILSTKMYCGEGSKLEQKLFDVLRKTVRYHRPPGPPKQLKDAGGKVIGKYSLTLYDENGAVLARLAHRDWD